MAGSGAVLPRRPTWKSCLYCIVLSCLARRAAHVFWGNVPCPNVRTRLGSINQSDYEPSSIAMLRQGLPVDPAEANRDGPSATGGGEALHHQPNDDMRHRRRRRKHPMSFAWSIQHASPWPSASTRAAGARRSDKAPSCIAPGQLSPCRFGSFGSKRARISWPFGFVPALVARRDIEFLAMTLLTLGGEVDPGQLGRCA